MTKAATRFALWLGVAVVLTCLTWIALQRLPEIEDSPFQWLLNPSVIGMMLVGGVHGGASEPLMLTAMSIANGLFWTALSWMGFALARVVKTLRRNETDS